MALTRCKNCLMPSTRPRVVFTDGKCNACIYHETKKDIDWDARKAEFIELVKSHKQHPSYDAIVPFSGGKDSAAIAYRLKFEYGFNPLLVCYGQLIWTHVGQHNLNQVCSAGFDVQYHRVNQDVSKKLARRFFIERGHPKAHYDAGINATPIRAAQAMGIPLVVYAEHGESEYGGHILNKESHKRRDLEEVLEHCVGDHPRNWATDGLTEADLYPYIMPDDADGIHAAYFSYYHKWDIYENALLCRDKLNFRRAQVPFGQGTNKFPGRSAGSFEGFDSIDDGIDGLDFYLMYLKFGFGRATRMASRMINYGHMTQEQGMKHIEKYDGEFPYDYLPEILDYLDMDEVQLREVLLQHDEDLDEGKSIRERDLVQRRQRQGSDSS